MKYSWFVNTSLNSHFLTQELKLIFGSIRLSREFSITHLIVYYTFQINLCTHRSPGGLYLWTIIWWETLFWNLGGLYKNIKRNVAEIKLSWSWLSHFSRFSHVFWLFVFNSACHWKSSSFSELLSIWRKWKDDNFPYGQWPESTMCVYSLFEQDKKKNNFLKTEGMETFFLSAIAAP